MCRVDECEPWSIYNESNPTARRAHRCTECRRKIQPGEKYRRIEGLIDDRWSAHKICRHCDSLSQFMVRLCDGWVLDDLYSELVEHWWDGYRSVPFGRLIVGMKRKWRDGTDPVPVGCGDMARELMEKAVA